MAEQEAAAALDREKLEAMDRQLEIEAQVIGARIRELREREKNISRLRSEILLELRKDVPRGVVVGG